MNIEKERNKIALRRGISPELADFFLIKFDRSLYISNYRREIVQLSREKYGKDVMPVFLDIWEEDWLTMDGEGDRIIFYLADNKLEKIKLIREQ